jgi:two-component system nitrogen regulation response regulator GlnG/two-component system response regulator HydG
MVPFAEAMTETPIWERTTLDTPPKGENESLPPVELALAVFWSGRESGRLGEVLLPREEQAWFGRHEPGKDAGRLLLIRQRPGANEPAAAPRDQFLSRKHLQISRDGDKLSVRCEGRQRMRHEGQEIQELLLARGDTIEIDDVYGLVCIERPPRLERWRVSHAFGEPDADGIVGESVVAWELRRRVAFAAQSTAHVLITGPSGTGKELVARAIHRGSARSSRELVARNAATLPSGLIDAELFGNRRNYPNPGMPEREGLVGSAHGSDLFLDEIGELGQELQAHLLRLLDSGEYQRLGEDRARVADLRFIGATNRPSSELKHDLAARLALRIAVPGLDERLEDIALLARQIVLNIAQRNPHLGQRFVRHWDGEKGEPRLSCELARALVCHEYSTHVRELEMMLWRSIESSPGPLLELTPPVRDMVRWRAPARLATEISESELRAALERHKGKKKPVCAELRISRDQLLRLRRKYGLP